jgi:hypothetical protein
MAVFTTALSQNMRYKNACLRQASLILDVSVGCDEQLRSEQLYQQR